MRINKTVIPKKNPRNLKSLLSSTMEKKSEVFRFPADLVTFTKEILNPLSAKPHKMVKHTQIIRRQVADELFKCV